eukprot:15078089-Alexandrium_andersonii.AAC.1
MVSKGSVARTAVGWPSSRRQHGSSQISGWRTQKREFCSWLLSPPKTPMGAGGGIRRCARSACVSRGTWPACGEAPGSVRGLMRARRSLLAGGARCSPGLLAAIARAGLNLARCPVSARRVVD